MSAHQSSGSLFIITCFILMSGEVKTLIVPGSTDPCYSYTVLDEPWRATNYSNIPNWRCDVYATWVGWYRLMYQGLDIRMPESCVEIYVCGTHATLWLYGGHPQRQDGIVTRQICGNWAGDCCYYKSYPIRVKACQGDYYVYEFVTPVQCVLGYCADITTVKAPVDSQIELKHLAGLRMRFSSVQDFKLSSTNEIFLNQLKTDLVTKGFPTNITLNLRSISKRDDVSSATLQPGTC